MSTQGTVYPPVLEGNPLLISVVLASYEKNPDNVARGYKATISNPNVSEEAKQNAVQHLQEMGVSIDNKSGTSSTKKSPQASTSFSFYLRYYIHNHTFLVIPFSDGRHLTQTKGIR